MGTESVAKQVLDNVKSELAAIVRGGTNAKSYTYNYTPGAVALVKQWVDSYFKDSSASDMSTPIYLVRDTGNEVSGITPAFGELSRSLDVPVLCAMRDRRGQRDPFEADTLESEIRENMIGDVIAKLMESRTRGNVAYDTSFDRVDRERFREGWIAAEILFSVSYFHADGKP